MNKITLGFFLAKSKTTIKGLLVLLALLFMNTQVSWGQLLQWNTLGNTGTETTEASIANDANIAAANLTQSGIIPGANGNRFGGGAWFDVGNTNPSTLANAIAGNNYIEFVVTPNSGYSFTPTSFVFKWDRSSTGPSGATLRSSADGFASDLGSVTGMASGGAATTTDRTITISGLTNITAATTFRIYAYGSTATGGTGGFDCATGSTVNVALNGTVSLSGSLAPEINIKGNSVSILDGATPASTLNGTDFGTVATSTNVVKTYTIQNLGSADLAVSGIALTNGTNYTISGITLPATITAGTETTFTVTFNSATAGIFNDAINITSTDSDESTYNFDITAIAETPIPNISVMGNGVVIAVADITPSATDHTDFGSTDINTDLVKTYTIENTGTGDLTINTILMANDPSSKYTIGGITLPATIPASGSTTFTVTFNSAVVDTFADTVLIDSNDPVDSTYDFAVTSKIITLNFAVGDISIVGVTADAPDSFSFVNWVEIPAGAQMSFTDNTWNGSSLLTNENTVVWENNTGNTIPVGTVVYVYDNTTAALADLGTIVSGNLSGISNINDNIFIYEGSAASPNFIYGLSNADWLSTYVVSTNTSMLPSSLNVTNGNIVTGAFDNVEYSGALAPKDEKSSFAGYKTLVNDPANWTKSNTYFALNSIDFELAAVWEGATWTNAKLPTSIVKTVINDTYSTTADGPFTAKKLTVTSLCSLTINTGTNVTVQNEVINNGALVVENNANLIQVNNTTNTGTITVNRMGNALFRSDYTMWSSPVLGTQTLGDFSPLTTSTRFYIYDNTLGTNGLYSSVPATTPFSTGTGYLIRMPNVGTTNYNAGNETLEYNGVFTGVPNNGDVTLAVTSGSYNAVGNPYPSTISADLFMSGNGITSNTDALYFWRKTNNPLTSSYATYTTAGGTANSGDPLDIEPNGTIQIGQGFIAKSTSTSLIFTNSMRTSNNSNQILKTKKIERNRIWLNLSNEVTPINQMMVAYMDGATQGIDAAIDGRLFNDSKTALTSLLNNEEFVIQGRSLPFDGSDVVPLAFKTEKPGDYTIAIDHTDGLFANGQDVYLVDSNTGAETNLKTSPYTFTSVSGVDNSRFSLKYQKTLKVDSKSLEENAIIVYNKNGVIYVNSVVKAINKIKVFDIQGRLVVEQNNINENTASVHNMKATNQVLIVQVTLENNKVINKKIEN